jgi:cell cycle checkpoint protein
MEADYLKDAFNELDWSSQLITFTLSPDAPHFRLSTSDTSASCQVDYPKESEVFESFECETTCSFSYKLSLLQPAVKALSLSHKTQLRINNVRL